MLGTRRIKNLGQLMLLQESPNRAACCGRTGNFVMGSAKAGRSAVLLGKRYKIIGNLVLTSISII